MKTVIQIVEINLVVFGTFADSKVHRKDESQINDLNEFFGSSQG